MKKSKMFSSKYLFYPKMLLIKELCSTLFLQDPKPHKFLFFGKIRVGSK